MRPSQHRWLDRLVLLPVVAIVIAVAAIIGAATGDRERVTQAWYLADLPAPDVGGAVPVTEQITYDFGANDRHGIYRDVPDMVANPAPNGVQPDGSDEHVRVSGAGSGRERHPDPDR